MSRKQNETENMLYTSLDNLLDEVRQVAFAGMQLGVPSEYIADYIHEQDKTITRMIRTGVNRPFDTIYNEFIDEVIANGRYNEWLEFINYRAGFNNV